MFCAYPAQEWKKREEKLQSAGDIPLRVEEPDNTDRKWQSGYQNVLAKLQRCIAT